MALPKLHHTQYSHYLTGLGKTIKYRPFTNAEQKTLLLAKESKGKPEEDSVIVDSVRQIVSACTMGKLDVNSLSTFDIEDLFIRIRSKSVGEIIEVRYRYDYEEGGKRLSKFIDVAINSDEITVVTNPEHDKKIQLDDKVGIVMKYPTFEMLEMISRGGSDDSEVIKACIDYIYDEEEIYNLSDVSKEDVDAFYDDIDASGILKIKKFFDTMPKLTYTVDIEVMPGKFETVNFEGLKSFFS